jgi:hypothetical protein
MAEHYGLGTRDNNEFDQLQEFGNGGKLHPLSNSCSGDNLRDSSHREGQAYYSLWHRRTDETDRDHDMQRRTYSTREKAEAGRGVLRGKLGFRDYPDAFEIDEGRIDETYKAGGFVTVPGDPRPEER